MKRWAIYTIVPVSAIFKLQDSWSGAGQGQETFLAPYADKQTDNYDTRVLKPPSLSIKCKTNGIEP